MYTMWYECWAGWGSIKSHWYIGLFFSLSLSVLGVGEADRWGREIKKSCRRRKNEKNTPDKVGPDFAFVFFFPFGCISGFLGVDYQSVCGLAIAVLRAQYTLQTGACIDTYLIKVQVECDMIDVCLPTVVVTFVVVMEVLSSPSSFYKTPA